MVSNIFRRTLIAFSLFFVATCAVAYWDHIRLRPHDLEDYVTLVKENRTERARHALETHPATQSREKVQKDFWIVQNGERQHLRILSQGSELILHERKKKLEAVEKLHNLECWLQEGFSLSQKDLLQQVRHLTAQEGIYFYPSHHFLAQTVHLQFYRLPGRELPKEADSAQAFFSGTAEEASFSACGKTPTFSARHLHAVFDPTQGLP